MNFKLSLKSILFILSAIFPFALVANDNWAQVRIPVACIRDGKGHSTEMTSQAIMGTPLRVLETDGEWLLIETPEGYNGYMNISSVAVKSDSAMEHWRSASRLVSVSRPEVKIYVSPDERKPSDVISELVLTSIVEGRLINDSTVIVTLPDGRSGYADSKAFIKAEDWASRPFNMDRAMETAYWLSGTPYLWGACSTKSVDCSGLVRVVYFDRGILTLRDARQQIGIGKRIEPENLSELKRGDLLFFSNTPDGRISHVALYDAEGRYIHSSGLVKTNHMSDDDPDFSKRYYRGASRIVGMEDTPGIFRMINHPWYFNIK
ncbi:C40 family peptidase [Duncaniella dubosii]|jgi:cell wall-associated NlpC family hydrolase|uniref:C40 family peptidase n=1 Tax=Duncaniella dubosii TaxID=2518971 RepID=UPI0025A969EF|nr:C40 family peptidase [uncultured Duncaniella sp.]